MSTNPSVPRRTFILGPSRCRTAWLAAFLTSDNCHFYHEASRLASSLEHFDALMSVASKSVIGDSDSGLCLDAGWLLVKYPEARFLVVHRDKDETRQSFERYFDVSFRPELWDQIYGVYEEAAQVLKDRAMLVDFDALSGIPTMQRIWRHCTWGSPWSNDRYYLFRNLVVQVPRSYDLTLRSGFIQDLISRKETPCPA